MSFYRTKRSEVRYNDKRKSNLPPVPHTRFLLSPDSDSKIIYSFTHQTHNLERTKGKIKFCSHICSCFMTSDCQIHFTRATDFFRINYYKASWRSIWRLNGSEDKTYHRGGQNDSSVQDAINYQ